MTGFRVLLAALFLWVVLYTIPVLAEYGIAPLFPTFFGDMAQFTWPGQFNADFFGFLLLSGAWVAWRNHFSPLGLALGVLAVLGGIPFLTAYLLFMSFRVSGDMKTLIMGRGR
jgi:hypothetical protein